MNTSNYIKQWIEQEEVSEVNPIKNPDVFKIIIERAINPDISNNQAKNDIKYIVENIEWPVLINDFYDFIESFMQVETTTSIFNNYFIYERLKPLVEFGPELNFSMKNGYSPLSYSIFENNYFMFDLILHSPMTNPDYSGENGITPLVIAANVEYKPKKNINSEHNYKRDKEYYIDRLLDLGASPTHSSHIQFSLQERKTENYTTGFIECLKNDINSSLIRKMLKIDKKSLDFSSENKTIFSVFLNLVQSYPETFDAYNNDREQNHYDILKALLENGLNPNNGNITNDDVDSTPLQICMNHPADMNIFIPLLMEYGANPYLKNKKNINSFELAEIIGYTDDPMFHYIITYQNKTQLENKFSDKPLKNKKRIL